LRLLVATLLTAPAAFTQHHEMKPSEEKPVALYKGLGTWSHPISTKSAEAQKYFDQGLALLYGFNRYEALRSFRKASELDTSAVMPYWGMAAAQGPYINMDGDPSFDLKAACAAVESGRKANGSATARERGYLEALSTWCPEYRPSDYARAIKALADKWPDDLDAQTLSAESLMIPQRWKWYGPDGRPADGVPEAERLLEGVLRRRPEHPGANHYYIHAVESSPTPERAIPSAQRLMGVVPSAGHMVHMPAHIWLVLGEYGLAAEVNERASAVDREYIAATNVTFGSYTPYYIHNLHFVVYARAMQGHRAEALKAAGTITEAAAMMTDAVPEMADYFLTQALFARIRTLAWDEVFKTPQPAEKLRDKLPVNVAIGHYGRALVLLARSDRGAAAKERALFEQVAEKVPADAHWGTGLAGGVMKLAREIMAARFGEDAISHWRKAVEIQDALTYDEPPAWYYPVRESLGAELVRAGRPAEGEAVLREGLRRSPRNGFMLFALMESLKAQKKDLEEVKKEFEAVWAKSDVRLSLGVL
jgi:tetratricopeptide (TPR) repeat protein